MRIEELMIVREYRGEDDFEVGMSRADCERRKVVHNWSLGIMWIGLIGQ